MGLFSFLSGSASKDGEASASESPVVTSASEATAPPVAPPEASVEASAPVDRVAWDIDTAA